MFPEELPAPDQDVHFCGKLFLDPFLGSGTTSLAAKNLNGYEINPDFRVIQEKLGKRQGALFHEVVLENQVSAEKGKKEFTDRLASLSYVFRDLTPG